MVRTERGPLRPVWAALYWGLAQGVAAYLRHGQPGGAAYVARGLAIGPPVYGLSDIDLVVVIPGDPERPEEERKLLRERWRRLCRLLPPLVELLPDVAFYEDAELREATVGSIFRYGLDRSPMGSVADRAAFFGAAPPADDFGLRSRPGVHGPMTDWRLLCGPDRRPRVRPPERQDRRIAAWLELQFWWSFAFGVAVDPARPRSAFLCVKLVAEPARIWLSLVEGDDVFDRRQVLERALERLPDERDALRWALELHRRLYRCPYPPLDEAFPAFTRLSSRIARRLCQEVDGHGTTEVRLRWSGEEELVLGPNGYLARPDRDPHRTALLPLVDWRALAVPSFPDEAFTLVAGKASDPAVVASAAKTARRGLYPMLREDNLFVLPALGVWERGFLRAVQCGATDPVSFALASGHDSAAFPNVPGWSAEHWARRAVAEHNAWLQEGEGPEPRLREWLDGRGASASPELRTLAKLLTAARATLFLESLSLGHPELHLTAGAVTERLAERRRDRRAVAESALESYHAGMASGLVPPAGVIAALRGLVKTLPGYAREA